MNDRVALLFSPLGQWECRRLFGAQLVSGVGDWAGRLALAVLVFDRSDSALWTAAVMVVSLLPWIGLGQLISTLADRYGAVSTMVVADVARGVLFVTMLAPVPVWALLVLAFAAGLCVPPFVAARGSALVDVVEADRYGGALALFGMTSQAELVVGYALGGTLIAVLGVHTTLVVNALSFLASALMVIGLRGTVASKRVAGAPLGWAGVKRGATVWRDDALCRRALVLFIGSTMFMSLPEALVVPFADEIGASGALVGLLAATIAVGAMIAMAASPEADTDDMLLHVAARRALILSLITAAGFVLAISWLPVAGVAALFASGAVDAIAVPTNQVVGQRLQRDGRATALSVAGGMQYTSQAVAITAGGALAIVFGSGVVLAFAALCTASVMAWSLVNPTTDAEPDSHGALDGAVRSDGAVRRPRAAALLRLWERNT